MLNVPMHSANCKVWWRRNNGLGLLFMIRPLSSSGVKFSRYSIQYNILDYSVVPTLREQFGEGPFLFQHDNASMHKARSIQKWFFKISAEELDWPAQSPDLNPI